MVNPKLIDVINKRLKNKTFDIEIFDIPFEIKVEITGQKEMISAGQLKDYLTYTVFIQPHASEDYNRIINMLFRNKITNVVSYNMDSKLYNINNRVNEILHNIIIYYKDDLGSILTKIVNEQIKDQITESFLIEGKYDGITRKLVKDIILVYKENDAGDFTLPEYFDEEMTYNFGAPADDLTVNLILKKNINTDEFEVTGSYTRENNTITIVVIYNPDKKIIITQKLIGELNENVRHELEHMIQKWRGSRFRKEPETPIKYYTQKKEIEAQVAGFKRRAKQEKRPVEDIIREWFKKYQHRHSLDPKEVEKVIKKLLREFPQNPSN